MQDNSIVIEIYDQEEKSTTTLCVEKVFDNVFRVVENDPFMLQLTRGTEFETRVNAAGKHEILWITKESDFITKRFFLTSQFKESEYWLLGDEIMRQGGFWQVDLGSIATINLPKDFTLCLEEIFKIFNFNPTFIVED